MPNTSPQTSPSYIGRFAPSPSGSLHFGSLIAALGSHLRARSQQGQWLVRIEDIDPPREVEGASDDILRTLSAYGLQWDGSVLYQSQRLPVYQHTLDTLLHQDKAYYCQCTRKQIKQMGGSYNGRCGQAAPMHTQGAIRLRNPYQVNHYQDNVMGHVEVDAQFAAEDFIIKRRDGLYAYQLAVVLDDIEQGITEVVRGCDLLTPTCWQLSLYQAFGTTPPQWLHLPLACAEQGRKLSKQNHAQAIDIHRPQKSINAALAFLGQAPVALEDNVQTMIAQAVAQFNLDAIPKQTQILLET